MPLDYGTDALDGILVREMHGSPEESIDESGFKAVVRLMVPWADRFTVIDDIMGNQQFYPYKPSTKAIPLSASSVPMGKSDNDGEGCTYPNAVITFNFGIKEKEKDEETGDVFSESVEPQAEFMTLDHTNFRWGATTGPKIQSSEAPGFLVCGFDYVQTRYNLESVPAIYLSALGKVNEQAVTSRILGFTFPPETLLYASCSPSKSTKSDGSGNWTVAGRYSYRPNTWNKFWRASANPPTWQAIYNKDGGVYKSYQPGTLPLI